MVLVIAIQLYPSVVDVPKSLEMSKGVRDQNAASCVAGNTRLEVRPRPVIKINIKTH